MAALPAAGPFAQLSLLLEATLDPARSREATRALEAAAQQPGFAIALLTTCGAPAAPLTVRHVAATCFKNHVRRHWEDVDSPALSEADRAAIHGGIVRLMLQVPPLVQRQISEALAHISRSDFPDRWQGLLPELVAELGRAGDVATLLGLLETVQAVFERFRGAFDTDENRLALKYALDHFAAPLTETFRSVDARADAAARAGASKAEQEPLLRALKTMCALFYLLNWLDLPEFFEDHLNEWMTWFHKYLGLSNAVVTSAVADSEAGALEQLQGAALECVELYAQKWDEEFEPFFMTFVMDVWKLLAGGTMAEDKLMCANMDGLVTRAVKFLASVVAKPQHASVFAQESSLRELLARIVLPNMRLRATDVESFEDNAEDFIRGDIEGNNQDTRRRVVTDLVRALCRTHNAQITPLCLECVARTLSEYEAAKAERAVVKDAAVALMMAVAAKSTTEAGGVTAVNDLVNVGEFLQAHVLPELQGSVPLGPSVVDERPIAKAAAIKFVATFRGLFSREQMHGLLPLLVPFIRARSFVVHTYAAAAIERLLSVKDTPPAASPRGWAPPSLPRVSAEALQPLLPMLMTNLFGHIANAAYPENEYVMRCVMRAVVLSRERLAPLASQVIQSLTSVLLRVCRNPANPVYNHYLFETVAALMRAVCSQRAEAVADFEAMLMPPFQEVLTVQGGDFLPYVFQLLAEMLELRPPPLAPATHSLSEGYKSLLVPCLTPALWLQRGCVPALTDLLVAFLHKGAAFVVESGQLLPLLALWNKLMTTKNQEQFAFTVLDALVTHVPLAALQPHMAGLMQVTLTRVQQSRALRIARMFAHSAALLCGVHGPAALESPLEALGAGTFLQVVDNVLAVTANRIPAETARLEAAVGLSRLLCETPALFAEATARTAGSGAWSRLLCTVVELATAGPPPEGAVSTAAATAAASAAAAAAAATASRDRGAGAGPPPQLFAEECEEEADVPDAGEQLPAEYQAAFSRLVHAAIRRPFALAAVAPDPRRFVGQALCALAARSAPGLVAGLVAASPVAVNAAGLVERSGGRL